MLGVQISAQPQPSHEENPVEDLKNETAPDHRQKPAFRLPDFSNFQEAHKPKSNLELIRAYGIFTVCQIRPIVQHADTLLDFTKKVLGSTITYGLVRATFFGHFCAGRTMLCIRTVLGCYHCQRLYRLLHVVCCMSFAAVLEVREAKTALCVHWSADTESLPLHLH